MTPRTKGRPAASESQGTEQVIRHILDVAAPEFARKGFAGARVDEIAAATRTSKRMIYYHFGGKEELYLAVLEDAFRRARAAERALRLDDLAPEDGLRELVRFRFDYHHEHRDFVRLVMNENILQGAFLARSDEVFFVNSPALESIGSVYARGCASGAFRPGLDLVDIHLMISSLCFYGESNRYTFSHNFRRDLAAPAEVARRRANVQEMVVRYLRA